MKGGTHTRESCVDDLPDSDLLDEHNYSGFLR